jgi:hypothetical protein
MDSAIYVVFYKESVHTNSVRYNYIPQHTHTRLQEVVCAVHSGQ